MTTHSSSLALWLLMCTWSGYLSVHLYTVPPVPSHTPYQYSYSLKHTNPCRTTDIKPSFQTASIHFSRPPKGATQTQVWEPLTDRVSRKEKNIITCQPTSSEKGLGGGCRSPKVPSPRGWQNMSFFTVTRGWQKCFGTRYHLVWDDKIFFTTGTTWPRYATSANMDACHCSLCSCDRFSLSVCVFVM